MNSKQFINNMPSQDFTHLCDRLHQEKGKEAHCQLRDLSANGLDFHFSSFHGVVTVLPTKPCHSVRIATSQVATIQVGTEAVSIPPGSFAYYGTTPAISVIVLVLSAKRHAVMIRKRVPSCSCKMRKSG